jgi:hypothetical protein
VNLRHDLPDITPIEYRLLARYSRHGILIENTKTTAKACGVSVRSVQYARGDLERKGYIKTHRRAHTIFVSVTDWWAGEIAQHAHDVAVLATPRIPGEEDDQLDIEDLQDVPISTECSSAMSTEGDTLQDLPITEDEVDIGDVQNGAVSRARTRARNNISQNQTQTQDLQTQTLGEDSGKRLKSPESSLSDRSLRSQSESAPVGAHANDWLAQPPSQNGSNGHALDLNTETDNPPEIATIQASGSGDNSPPMSDYAKDPVNFQGWMDLIDAAPDNSKRIAVLMHMARTLFTASVDRDTLSYSRLGKLAKQLGHGELARRFWVGSIYARGNPLSYVQAMGKEADAIAETNSDRPKNTWVIRPINAPPVEVQF